MVPSDIYILPCQFFRAYFEIWYRATFVLEMCLLPLLWKSTQSWPSCNPHFFSDLYVDPCLRNFALKQRLCIVLAMFISEPNPRSLKPLQPDGFRCSPLGWRDWDSLKRSFGQECRVHSGSALNDIRGHCQELWTIWELTR